MKIITSNYGLNNGTKFVLFEDSDVIPKDVLKKELHEIIVELR